jgi:hypothetical protein
MDSGDIRSNFQPAEIRLAQSATASAVVYQGSGQFNYWLADSHGLWFTGPGGIYLYALGFQRISDDVGFLAGTCS